MKRIRMFLLLLLTTIALPGATIDFLTGWTTTDGHGLGVGPVVLSIDGLTARAWDYTFDYTASPGDIWTASLTMLPTLPPYFATDAFAAFKDAEITWIANDFLSASTTGQLIADQYAMYGIFEPAAPSNAASALETSLAFARALGGPAPGWVFVDSPAGSKLNKQGFLVQSPEPSTSLLIGIGLLMLLIGRGKRLLVALAMAFPVLARDTLATPEPASIGLMALGGAAIALGVWRRRVK